MLKQISKKFYSKFYYSFKQTKFSLCKQNFLTYSAIKKYPFINFHLNSKLTRKFFENKLNSDKNIEDVISLNITDKNLIANITNILNNSKTNKYNGIEIDIFDVFEKFSYKREDNNFNVILKELLKIWTKKEKQHIYTLNLIKY